MASYTKIVAPYDGVVIRRKVDTGQLTTPGTAGEPLFVVARSDMVTISVGVPEADAPFVERRGRRPRSACWPSTAGRSRAR